MDAAASLTVYFEEPFWVGVYERRSGTRLEACKVTFGAEPKDYEVYDFFLKHWSNLRFSPPVADHSEPAPRPNPKRMQRTVQSQLLGNGVGTKAQQALKLQQEQNLLERKALHRAQTELEKQQRFVLRQKKKKEKHRGR